jgi:hypothetical protein
VTVGCMIRSFIIYNIHQILLRDQMKEKIDEECSALEGEKMHTKFSREI